MDPLTLAFTMGFNIIAGAHEAEGILGNAALAQKIADSNAFFAELDAWEAEAFGYTQSARYQAVIDRTVGAQRVAFASQNVNVNTGTAKAIQQETKLIGFLNTLDMQKQARDRAMGFRMEASNIRLGSDFRRAQAGAQAGAARGAGFGRALSIGIDNYGTIKSNLPEFDVNLPSFDNTWGTSIIGGF